MYHCPSRRRSLGAVAAPAFALSALALAPAAPARAQVAGYFTRAQFDAAFPRQRTETFDSANVPRATKVSMSSPLNVDTNNATFARNEVADWLSVTTSGPGSGTAFDLGVFGTDFNGGGGNRYTSPLIGIDVLDASLNLNIAGPGTRAIGFDFFSPFVTDRTTIQVFGAGNTLLSSFTFLNVDSSGRFLGVSSASANITRVTVTGATFVKLVDNVSTAAPSVSRYADAASFLAENPDARVEGFDTARVPPRTKGSMPGLLDAATNNAFFRPGEVADWLRVTTSGPGSGTAFDLGVFGTDFNGGGGNRYSSPLIGVDVLNASLNLTFTPLAPASVRGARAVGFDLYSPFVDDTTTVEVFSTSGALLETQIFSGLDSGGRFFGYRADQEFIGSVRVTGSTFVKLVDNVRFVAAAPEPVGVCLAVPALGVAALARRRRRAPRTK